MFNEHPLRRTYVHRLQKGQVMADKTVFERYYEMLLDWKQNPDLDDYQDHLPILVAAEHFANQMRAETDRIVEAIHFLSQS
jgi:hypothetical protein